MQCSSQNWRVRSLMNMIISEKKLGKMLKEPRNSPRRPTAKYQPAFSQKLSLILRLEQPSSSFTLNGKELSNLAKILAFPVKTQQG